MVKEVQFYVCQECSYKISKWMGKCPECHQWNTFVMESEFKGASAAASNRYALDGGDSSGSGGGKGVLLESDSRPQLIGDIELNDLVRLETHCKEFDRVVGGGIVQGSLGLIGGEPGIGKSTLLMEICSRLARSYPQEKLLYVSGEESSSQIAQRSKRMGIDLPNLYIYHENCWQKIEQRVKEFAPKFLVIDSIQTTYSMEISAAPGTLTQVREITYALMNVAKSRGITSFLIGHVTKDGMIAGPKVLEHMVDMVLSFEGDEFYQYRMLRAIKNRFGNVNEVGLFEMTDMGLKEVDSPVEYFLLPGLEGSYGRALSCILEGSRPLLVEIQALVVENRYGNGRRTTQGMDNNRLAMLVAIIEKYFQIPLSNHDIYVNVVGGMKNLPRDTDLCVLAALLSSLRQKSISQQNIFVGELGLAGEVRQVSKLDIRLRELEKLNYKRFFTSYKTALSRSKEEKKKKEDEKQTLEVVGLKLASELEKVLFCASDSQ